MEKLPVPLTASVRVLLEPKRFYDLKIPLAKCKNNIPAQRILITYDTYALKVNKGLRLGWRSILWKIRVHRCWKVFSALPQCADRDTKWTFNVDTFTSTKSTHWKNSNILATQPKIHNSILKVKHVMPWRVNSISQRTGSGQFLKHILSVCFEWLHSSVILWKQNKLIKFFVTVFRISLKCMQKSLLLILYSPRTFPAALHTDCWPAAWSHL